MSYRKSNTHKVTSIPQRIPFDVTPFKKFFITGELLEDFTHVNDTFQEFSKETKTQVATPQPTTMPSVKEPSIFVPKERDNLFWCFYLMKHGVDAYLLMPHRNMVTEKNLKIEYIEKLRENKPFIKVNKLGPLSHIENFLLNETSIDMKTFHALCLFEGLSCIITFPSFYYEINMETDDIETETQTNVHLLTKIEDTSKFGFKKETTHDEISLVRTHQYKVDNLSKPIKAMTAYKMSDLISIANKLNISLPDKVKKKDIYQSIVQVLS
jgi:hypothetical protein